MPETRQITYTHQEIVEVLVKEQGIHEGLWGLYVEFTISAANMSPSPGSPAVPAAIVPVQRLGIQRFDEELPGLTVDAAVVNPAS